MTIRKAKQMPLDAARRLPTFSRTVHRRSARLLVLLAALLLLPPVFRPEVVAAGPPIGFTESTVATIASPTALAFLPIGEMLGTSKGGRLSVVRTGGGTTTVALNLSRRICANAERGLLGVAVDPAFTTNKRIYLFYTAR